MLDATKVILQDWRSVGFDSHTTICKMLLAQIKISPSEREYSSSVERLVRMFRNHYLMTPIPTDASVNKLMQEFEEIIRSRQAALLQDSRLSPKEREELLAEESGSNSQALKSNANGPTRGDHKTHWEFGRKLYRRFHK